MKSVEVEQLLFEGEGPALDFKRDQYAFVKATEEEKSELLKDILGFVNCWRRSEAFILIGVQEVQGGRSIVYGVTEHLQDHSLQQFVNNLTNRPVQFRYEACEVEGKQVGIVRIDIQRRPIFLKRDYGKLKKGEVYVRRGSSTDPSKPADPDEIALMGSAHGVDVGEASLTVEFAAPDREQALGRQIEWSAEFCHMPDPEDIPILDDRLPPITLPGGRIFNVPSVSYLDPHNRLNETFYRELANYLCVRKLVKRIQLVIANIGETPATEVRLEIFVPNGQGVGVSDEAEIPDTPKRRTSVFDSISMKKITVRPAFRHAGFVDIERNEDRTKIEIDCGNLQPGRKVWTDIFCMGIGQSGEVKLTGHLYAANLPQPQEFTLSVNATIAKTSMTVDELLSQGNPSDTEEDDEEDEDDEDE